ncbi:unnamed protein product [Symbiodinium sp. CCMP2592]|nr:unnamed protein product [Symbiodinium sp. CCMP2592]
MAAIRHRLRLASTFCVAVCSEVSCRDGSRPPVADILVEELYLGRDPMLAPLPEEKPRDYDRGMTHVSRRDIDMVLFSAVQPVSFWLELGAFEGGSAILTAQRVNLHGLNTSVVAVDTFLGDAHVIWERTKEERQKKNFLRPDGTVALYDRFRSNVHDAGLQMCILPLPATSIVALKLMASLAARHVTPLPQVIYLDSAHEGGEVLLELRLAWKALSPGGILFGDDWVFAAGDNCVQEDVLKFATEVGADLDDGLGKEVQDLRTLGRVRAGVFVSYQSFQWFLRKRLVTTAQSEVTRDQIDPGYSCWTDGFDARLCCDEKKYGPGGFRNCWDLVFTFDRCCK